MARCIWAMRSRRSKTSAWQKRWAARSSCGWKTSTPTRCTPELERAILDDLDWLEIDWQPPLLRQSERFDAYAEMAETLKREGLIYPCFATRGEIARAVAQHEAGGKRWPRDPDGAPLYPALHKTLPDSEVQTRMAAGEPHAWRLNMEGALDRLGQTKLTWQEGGAGPNGETGTIAADPSLWGDAVLIRKDTPASYHLSCVGDDAVQNISHIVRGQDLFHATALHRLLHALLGLPEPRYHHHRLILDATGEKLSKSTGATGLQELRATGRRADEIKALLYHQHD
jgi:glutamyl-Q tRNA(Asp) synthetase